MKRLTFILIIFCLFLYSYSQENLVLNKTILSNNVTSASNAIDGNTTTYATASISTGIKYITIDMGKVVDITSMKLYFTTNYGKNYRISGSINNTTYQTISTGSGSTNAWIICPLSTAKGIRYIKVEMNTDAQNYLVELREFQVFGTLSPMIYEYDAVGNREKRRINYEIKLAQVQSALLSDDADTLENKEPELFLDEVDKHQIAVFPNPTKGLLKVNISNLKVNESATIHMYDLNGRLLKTIPNASENEVDISDKPNGMYIMKIKIGDKESEWKIIKK